MIKLLIVDDDPPVAEGLAHAIGAGDLPISTLNIAYSAKEALALFNVCVFDLVISDIRMPEMNGLELMEHIKQTWSGTKVIFFSGYADFRYAQEAVKLGASDFWLKPFEDEPMIARLRELIAELEREWEKSVSDSPSYGGADHEASALRNEWLQQQLIYGQIDHDRFIERLRQRNIALDRSASVMAIVVRIDEWSKFKENDNPIVLFSVQNVFANTLHDTGADVVMMHDHRRFLTVLLVGDRPEDMNDMARRFDHLLPNVQDSLFRVLQIVISVAVTGQPLAWEDLAEHLRYMLAKLSVSFGTGKLIASRGNRVKINYDFYTSRLNTVQSIIPLKDRDVFRQCIDELFNELEQNEMFVEHNFMYREICSMMMSQLLSKNQLAYDDLMTMERLSTYPSSHAAELKADLNKLFSKWIDAKPTFADDRKHMMTQQAKAFIEHHLHEEISLDTVAKRLYLNPSYLSKVFHQYTGEKLVSYMTRKKMERAVLLSDPAMKVQDIAGQLGYRSPNYFSKVFRSVYQLSPQEFRFAMASADRRPET